MISLQRSKEILSEESLSKKRKWDDPAEEISEKPEKIKSMKPGSDSDLQSQTQFPLEWQRCLDIKSGQIYFYNTRTNKRALGDPRSSLEPYIPASMSLDLELNLPSQSLGNNQVEDSYKKHDSGTTSIYTNNHFMNSNTTKDVGGLTRSPSWLTFEADQQEMVTAVCKKCYMLVMMCKSSPACPNCKFVHPSEPSPNLFNQEAEG
ncbi:hypothetical protein Pfo_016693 [Paulownia fortunei]|nr:hypothetical protein Pfo_016693 [Paulownia fortunei]